jgi:hypothetical protein
MATRVNKIHELSVYLREHEQFPGEAAWQMGVDSQRYPAQRESCSAYKSLPQPAILSSESRGCRWACRRLCVPCCLLGLPPLEQGMTTGSA